jgi:hypothetical protein
MILDKLDAAFAQNPDPDAVQAALRNPLRNFIKCKDVTPEFWNSIPPETKICFFYMPTGVWDGHHTIETVNYYLRADWGSSTGDRSSRGLINSSWMVEYFAVVAYDSRYEADPSVLYA